jgi:hypothetical protein
VLPLSLNSYVQETAMLAEMFMLQLEVTARAANEAETTTSSSRFVPITLPEAKAFLSDGPTVNPQAEPSKAPEHRQAP